MSLFSPAWKSDKEKKIKKALEAVENEIDPNTLEQIATEAPLEQVRLAALKKVIQDKALLNIALHPINANEPEIVTKAVYKINDPDMLKEIAVSNNDTEVCIKTIKRIAKLTRWGDKIFSEIAASKIDTEVGDAALSQIKSDSLWAAAAIRSKDPKVRMQAVQKLGDDKELYNIATGSDPEEIRLAAAKRVRSPQLIFDIITVTDSDDIRLALMEKTTDEEVFYRIAEQSKDESAAMTAIRKIENQNKLRKLVSSAALISVRAKALRKLKVSASEKKLLAFNILPNHGQNDIDYAFKNVYPEHVRCLEGFEYALLKAATEADDLTSRLEAIKLLSDQKNKDTAIKKIAEFPDAENKLALALEKTDDAKEKKILNKALDATRKRNKEEKNKRLAHAVLHDNNYTALDRITDYWTMTEVIDQIKEKRDAKEQLNIIARQTKNEAVRTSAENALQSVNKKYIKELRERVVDESEHYKTRYDAAIKLVSVYHVIGAGDPALKDAYWKLLNSQTLDTDTLLFALGREGSDIDVVYSRLISMADTMWELDILANYPSSLTINTLYRILSSKENFHQAARAAKALKKMYSAADKKTKERIEEIPQKTYVPHNDWGNSCFHEDTPEVSFFLD